MRVTIFGLGEAGSLLAADIVAAGADVHAFDPAEVATPPGVTRHDDPADAVQETDLVMAVTAAVDAQGAIAQAWDRLHRGTLYADLSTAPPTLKQDLSDTATLRGLSFADVALLATVPGNGLATPSLVSGSGADRYAEIVNGLGGDVDVIGDTPGDAAARKLLRSVVMKGLAALVIEAVEAAQKLDLDRWLLTHLDQLIEDADGGLLRRLVSGTEIHAERRAIEMESVTALLESVGVEPAMSRATTQVIRRVGRDGAPTPPVATAQSAEEEE